MRAKCLAPSRKGAKRYRVSRGFLCVFAPLRERFFRSSTLTSRNKIVRLTQLKKPETSQPTFSGITTFGRLPFTANTGDQEFDLAVLGIPFDGMVTSRPGA